MELCRYLIFSRSFAFSRTVALLCCLQTLAVSLPAWSDDEALASFRFSDFSLSPRASLQEPSQGGFELKDSWLEFQWRQDQSLNSLTGQFGFGTADLINPAIWYPKINSQVRLTTAFLQAKTSLMDFKAGLIPISNGYEGSVREAQLLLPETETRKHRWFTRRDIGVEMKTERAPYKAQISIHNGESADNLDQKLWVTGLWSYLNSSGTGILATAEVGGTDARSAVSPTETSLAVKEGFDFDPTLTSKIRQGSLAIYRNWLRHFVLIEWGRGEILQLDQKHPFDWGHVDFSWNCGGDLNLHFRYEQTQANLNSPATLVRSLGGGLSLTSKDLLSAVTLWANHHEENPSKPNDEALLIFRLSGSPL